MQQIHSYYKTNICNIPYLIPYGQAAAEGGKILRLNESGSTIWDGLCAGLDKTALLSLLAEKYCATQQEMAILKTDLEDFLALLQAHHILTISEQPHAETETAFFRIGEVTISCTGAYNFCQTYFQDFLCEKTAPKLQIHIIRRMPLQKPNGKILLRTTEVIICDCEEFYMILFLNHSVYEMHIKKDGSAADIYCRYNCPLEDGEALFSAIRFAFLYTMQKNGGFVLHSASILYKEKAWLFSGSSGTGKSTHTRLWKEKFQTPILNGDLNLICIKDGVPMVHGIPWCGTSNIYTAKSYPLGGIVFLKQATYNHASPLTTEEAALAIFQRLISPAWSQTDVTANLDFSTQLGGQIPTYSLQCTKDAAAAFVMRETIDSSLKNRP